MNSQTHKQRILEHLAQSRRARESSRFDDKTGAAQARVQRRLVAQRQDIARAQAAGLEAARLAEAEGNARAGSADAQSISGAETAEDPAALQALRDSRIQLRKPDSGASGFLAPALEGAAQATMGRRTVGIQSPDLQLTRPEQSEITRLQIMAKAEKARADFVAALLEDVLSASTARITKHQARLEALQAQINSLQGR